MLSIIGWIVLGALIGGAVIYAVIMISFMGMRW